MKRLVIVLAVLMLLPLNAFALQPMGDDNMGQITGQSGVSIAVDDIKLIQNISGLAYTDNDGTTGAAGTIAISNLRMTVNINAITSVDGAGMPVSPGRALQGGAAYTGLTADAFYNNVGNTAFVAKALTIDAGSMPVLSAGVTYNAGSPVAVPIAGVRIGLPTVEIQQSALSFTVTASTAGAPNSGADYGTISIGANTLVVLDGSIEIAPH